MGDDGSYKTAGCSSRGGGNGWTGLRTFRSWSCNLAGCVACLVGRGCDGVGGRLRLSEQRAQWVRLGSQNMNGYYFQMLRTVKTSY